jgi:hypothetical protein
MLALGGEKCPGAGRRQVRLSFETGGLQHGSKLGALAAVAVASASCAMMVFICYRQTALQLTDAHIDGFAAMPLAKRPFVA